jgi:hypothetical protein
MKGHFWPLSQTLGVKHMQETGNTDSPIFGVDIEDLGHTLRNM